MIKTIKLKDSGELIGKLVNLTINSNDPIQCTIDTMEQDGILVHYYTEEDDATSTCSEDDEGAELTYSYYPWSSITEIQYRESESY